MKLLFQVVKVLSIEANLQAIHQEIIAARQRFARTSSAVELLAVSKTQPVSAILQALQAGQTDFGENYVQEALSKIAALTHEKITWHFIGALQTNKLKAVAQHFSWVHSLAELKHAERLSAYRPATLPALNVCIQVNIDGEATKSGITPADLPALAAAIANLPRLKLRGLMALPKPQQSFAAQRAAFSRVRAAWQALREQGLALDTLSMGMSNDYIAAIAEGATIIRLGTAIFGERNNMKTKPQEK